MRGRAWVGKFKDIKKIYICYDNDKTGREGARKVAEKVKNDTNEIFIVTLPEEVGEGGDITDYLVKLKGDPNNLFTKYAKPYPEKFDISQFKQISVEELAATLGLTIKQDQENKIVTFLCELSAYTENAQFNISYNAPSSTGKSYIPTEEAKLFPEEDVIEIAYCSTTAFFHDHGQYDKEKNMYLVDLSKKILIFLDQPHMQLLERLRPLLSHDKKEILLKITDKTQISGLKTKNILLRGYPSVIFCTAGLNIDDQEATRFLLLSPEVNQEKIREGILESMKKESNNETYKSWLEENPERIALKERIRAIKAEDIKEINIPDYEKIVQRFLASNKILKPRHQRDIKRLVSLIKSFALLNLWWRDRSGNTIVANEDDIKQAFKIWENISISQELKLPPYIYKFYQNVILKAWDKKNSTTGFVGLTRQEIMVTHFEIYGRTMDTNQLRQQILPILETSGLITQEPDLTDLRKTLVFPTIRNELPDKNNREDEGGVKNNEPDDKAPNSKDTS
ncbi:MAG: toprim domain-containing protein [Candidatus Staskawiczbacteria bacterium]|nr:toprim domain-containing protein [Candidatus Staskawiczbacteria bacterium]